MNHASLAWSTWEKEDDVTRSKLKSSKVSGVAVVASSAASSVAAPFDDSAPCTRRDRGCGALAPPTTTDSVRANERVAVVHCWHGGRRTDLPSLSSQPG